MIDHNGFDALTDYVAANVPNGMGFTFEAAGEASDFVRFNHGRVRQAGSVEQGTATLRLIEGTKHASMALSLSGRASEDQSRTARALNDLRDLVPQLPDDPHLLLASEVRSTEQLDPVDAPDPDDVVNTVSREAKGTDLVGIYAGGSIWRGFANHRGQRNWFTSGGTHLSYSLVAGSDKAVKASVGSKTWSPDAVAASIAASRAQLAPLKREARKVEPGSYRAYLAPAAVAEIAEMMEWGGFSARGQQTKASPLQKLVDGEVSLSPLITVSEDTAGGMGPNFQSEGFVKPDRVELIRAGKHAGCLVSPRSAKEYGLKPNGAGSWERPNALAIAGGDLDEADALERLGTGVYVSNLWYLNYSDRNTARMTGMTRFATFWVEDGELVAPLSVMRFDVSLFDLFGKSLEALTKQVSFLPDNSTYEQRSTRSVRVPGALVSGLPFTL